MYWENKGVVDYTYNVSSVRLAQWVYAKWLIPLGLQLVAYHVLFNLYNTGGTKNVNTYKPTFMWMCIQVQRKDLLVTANVRKKIKRGSSNICYQNIHWVAPSETVAAQ